MHIYDGFMHQSLRSEIYNGLTTCTTNEGQNENNLTLFDYFPINPIYVMTFNLTLINFAFSNFSTQNIIIRPIITTNMQPSRCAGFL